MSSASRNVFQAASRAALAACPRGSHVPGRDQSQMLVALTITVTGINLPVLDRQHEQQIVTRDLAIDAMENALVTVEEGELVFVELPQDCCE
eukprot:5831311-Pleurochrysis_carterae.AAC.1